MILEVPDADRHTKLLTLEQNPWPLRVGHDFQPQTTLAVLTLELPDLESDLATSRDEIGNLGPVEHKLNNIMLGTNPLHFSRNKLKINRGPRRDRDLPLSGQFPVGYLVRRAAISKIALAGPIPRLDRQHVAFPAPG